jgi:hypothetical protein
MMDYRWHGVRIVHAGELDPNTPQTPGMNRAAAITAARGGADKLWAGTVVVAPKAKTGAHHHGHVESVIYVVSGKSPNAVGRAAGIHRGRRAGRLHAQGVKFHLPGGQNSDAVDTRARLGWPAAARPFPPQFKSRSAKLGPEPLSDPALLPCHRCP